MFFLVNYSRMLEKGLFHGRGADMLYMMLLSATLLLVCRVQNRTTAAGVGLKNMLSQCVRSRSWWRRS